MIVLSWSPQAKISSYAPAFNLSPKKEKNVVVLLSEKCYLSWTDKCAVFKVKHTNFMLVNVV